MIRVTAIASSSDCNSFLIQTRYSKILLDCGSTPKTLKAFLTRIGITPSNIDLVLITHSHMDHCGALDLFRSTKIIAHKSVFEHRVASKCTNRLEATSGAVLSYKGLTIIPFANSHDVPCFGYILETELQEKVVFCLDTGKITHRCKNADVYIIESNYDDRDIVDKDDPKHKRTRGDKGHLSIQQTTKYLNDNIGYKTKQVFLVHLSSGMSNDIKRIKEFEDYVKEKTSFKSIKAIPPIKFSGKTFMVGLEYKSPF